MGNKHRPPLNRTCTVCGKSYVGYSNARKYCDDCKKIKYKESMKRAWTKRNAKVQAEEHATYRKGKTKCLICGAWVIAPAMHSYQKHSVTAREYKQEFNLAFTKGLLPQDLKEKKRDHAFENGTAQNLLKYGIPTRLKKGEERVFKGVKRRLEIGQIKKLNI